MDYKELMCGDWVKVEQVTEVVNAKVLGVYKDGINYEVDYSGVRATNQIHTDYVSPIELTEEILVKNGYTIDERGTRELSSVFSSNIKLYSFPLGMGFYLEYDIEKSVCHLTDHYLIEIKYVHQLQHLLRLCGIEKEIEL